MAGEIYASNDLLKDRAENLRTLFNSGHALRLYANQAKLSPAIALNSFAEASYPGYTSKNLDGTWLPVSKVKDGQYQFSSPDWTFVASGPSTLLVYGWYITAAGKVKLACALPFPVVVTLNQPLTVRCDVAVWALAIV